MKVTNNAEKKQSKRIILSIILLMKVERTTIRSICRLWIINYSSKLMCFLSLFLSFFCFDFLLCGCVCSFVTLFSLGAIDINQVQDPVQRRAVLDQIQNFGQVCIFFLFFQMIMFTSLSQFDELICLYCALIEKYRHLLNYSLLLIQREIHPKSVWTSGTISSNNRKKVTITCFLSDNILIQKSELFTGINNNDNDNDKDNNDIVTLSFSMLLVTSNFPAPL
jgi:hypothetical protein